VEVSNGSLKVDDAAKGYTGRPRKGNGCVKSQIYQDAATKYE